MRYLIPASLIAMAIAFSAGAQEVSDCDARARADNVM